MGEPDKQLTIERYSGLDVSGPKHGKVGYLLKLFIYSR